MDYRFLATTSLALVFLATSGHASAEDKNDRSKEQVRKLQQALRSAEQERAQLASEKAQLEASAKSANDALEASKTAAASANRRSAALSSELQSTKTALGDLQQRYDQLSSKESEEASRLKAATATAARLDGELNASRAATLACEGKNVALYRYGRELISRYENRSLWDAASASEPVTGLKRVELENALEEYRDKLDAQRFSAGNGSAALGGGSVTRQ